MLCLHRSVDFHIPFLNLLIFHFPFSSSIFHFPFFIFAYTSPVSVFLFSNIIGLKLRCRIWLCPASVLPPLRLQLGLEQSENDSAQSKFPLHRRSPNHATSLITFVHHAPYSPPSAPASLLSIPPSSYCIWPHRCHSSA